MDFRTASLLGLYISREYAEKIFRLLVTYSDISASEAASRLNLNITTVQSFLEGLSEVGVLKKVKVTEKKRPYNRYSLIRNKINFTLDLNNLAESNSSATKTTSLKIREKNDSGAKFNTARYDSFFSSIIIWQGTGRDKTERKINLTIPQGKFLLNLPFPGAVPLSIKQLLEKSELDETHLSEIKDIVNVLIDHNVIENI